VKQDNLLLFDAQSRGKSVRTCRQKRGTLRKRWSNSIHIEESLPDTAAEIGRQHLIPDSRSSADLAGN